MTLTRRTLLAAVLALGLATILPVASAFAQSLDQAKAAGQVGERADGLLGLVTAAPGGVQSLVDRINAERMAEYARIAQQNNTTVQAVQAIAGQRLIDRTPSGQFVNPGDGWMRK